MSQEQRVKSMNYIHPDDVYCVGDKVPLGNNNYVEILSMDNKDENATITTKAKDGTVITEPMWRFQVRLIEAIKNQDNEYDNDELDSEFLGIK